LRDEGLLLSGERALAQRPAIPVRLVSLSIMLWGVLFFVTLFSIGLVVSKPGFWLSFAAGYWAASAALSAASTYAVGRVLAEYYAGALLLAEEYVPGLQPSCKEPRVYDAAADVAQAVAGFEQLSSLWALSAASLGLLGLYNGVLLYYLVRLGTRGLGGIGYSVSHDAPRTAALAALSVAGLGLGLFLVAHHVSRLLGEVETGIRALVEEAEATWMPSVD